MSKSLLYAITAIIVLGLVAFMMTYTVRFTESAVVTHFGQADEDSVVREAGLKWKLPSPFATVTKYDTRARFLEQTPETFATSDQVQLVVGAFLTWRVSDPLMFYKRHRGEAGSSTEEHYNVAQNNLRGIFRSAIAEISRFSRDELFAPGGSKLLELEQAIMQRMTNPADSSVEGVGSYGIAIDMVGITTIQVPQSVTEQVFAVMQNEREKVANELIGEGEAIAAQIVTEGQTQAELILNFAQDRAADFLNRGERAAATFLATMEQDPELAALLQRLELLRQGFGKRVTLILPTDHWAAGLFSPEAIERFQGREASGTSGAAGSGE